MFSGFIQFFMPEAVMAFLKAPEIIGLGPRCRFTRSSFQPVVTFEELSASEVRTVNDVASRLGGTVIGSQQYESMVGN